MIIIIKLSPVDMTRIIYRDMRNIPSRVFYFENLIALKLHFITFFFFILNLSLQR